MYYVNITLEDLYDWHNGIRSKLPITTITAAFLGNIHGRRIEHLRKTSPDCYQVLFENDPAPVFVEGDIAVVVAFRMPTVYKRT